ncbi:hypothetical protein BDP81DRAFT_392633 [Colletotrichum phormii]|uniref:FAD-binding PCMH-type domain-containing protein n=1 Tax=Colletotrichum phormii TaxID=359342 RepID=A0AAI9ZW06_9PEZI|nr:uncharacterized protein BDP81DRAFT_392633 [Colletotrichum phormii]KAK1638013.1 hypothetical protein BDP81DRAFT_392633 [Colletotrichum phormii]
MKHLSIVLFLLASLPRGLTLPQGRDAVLDACAQLAETFPKLTFQDSPEYSNKSILNWSQTCVLKPNCVFEPESAEDVARAVKVLRTTKTQFAVRSGGHMPVPGANNIDNPGVLISTERLNAKSLSEDGSVASIGPGLRWQEVYGWSSAQGFAVPGGRFGPVGVGGLLTGGGISYFGSRTGWSVNSVVAFQVVLADGSIVEASAQKNSDLWWALKGGQSNFGIVTRFDMKTFPVGAVWGGTIQAPQAVIDQYINAVASFAAPEGGSADPLVHANPLMLFLPNASAMVLGANLFYQGADEPASLANFTALPTMSTTTRSWLSLGDYLADVSGPDYADRGSRRLFWSLAVKAVPEAVFLVNSTFIERATADLSHLPNVLTSVTYQTISKAWLEAAQEAGGDAIDLDPTQGGIINVLISTTWTDPAMDETHKEFSDSVTKEILAKAAAKGLDHPFIYINDAGPGQPVFQSLGGGKSLGKLREVAQKYDPCGFFQTYQPGGFKLGDMKYEQTC